MKKNTKKTVFTAALLICMSTAVSAVTPTESGSMTKLEPVQKTIVVEGESATIKINPAFSIAGAPGKVTVNLQVNADLGNVPELGMKQLNRSLKDDRCGERTSVRSPRIQAYRGGLKVYATLSYDLYRCIFNRAHRLFAQSADIEILATPVIQGQSNLGLKVEVLKAAPDGLLGLITNGAGLNGLIENEVESQLRKKLGDKLLKLPADLKAYNITFHKVRFVTGKNGQLGLDIDASGEMTQKQLADLINKQINRG